MEGSVKELAIYRCEKAKEDLETARMDLLISKGDNL